MAHPPYHVFMSAAPSEKPTPRVFRSDCPRCRGTGWRKQRVLPVLLFVLSIGIFWLGFLACWKLLSGDVPSGDGHDAAGPEPPHPRRAADGRRLPRGKLAEPPAAMQLR